MYDRDRLIELFKERALKFGDFTLVSGKKSNYYLDGKQITLHSEGLRQVGFGLLELLKDVDFDAIGGMAIGADPIVGGVLAVAAEQGRSLDGFMVRKEAKGHGTQKYLEGPVEKGQKVVVIDDVVTTGGSALLAAQRCQDFGLEVVKMVGICDRLQGGQANFEENGLSYDRLLTVEDLGVTPLKD
ncbi:Orotate phosphoribosyltransferase [Polystyrenella longa]|uniref:Orotate phosphoribosyltransferase n=1 Tax=Polystyrenella longa TaxID=2528007 RepID=A0A518CGI3_9PLAN|nr:orotate phosphoribosyltransferase [Polystyrenella longa]QDU78336.1 Orotate phosphoribosyltransferase [Polystyrenella longa]